MSRLAVSCLRAASRPQTALLVQRLIQTRSFAATPSQPPEQRAAEIIDKLPSSPSLITKTGTAVLGTGLLAAAISQELYVVNEETVVLIATAVLFGYIAKVVKEPYRDWANSHIDRIKSVLDGARAEHTQAVRDRISSVEQMKDVVDITKALFAISKETATLESESFVLSQRTALAAELKSVLDSWVRYERQLKESEQLQLTKTVIDNVLKNLRDEKTQKEVLAAALSEIELLVKNKAI